MTGQIIGYNKDSKRNGLSTGFINGLYSIEDADFSSTSTAPMSVKNVVLNSDKLRIENNNGGHWVSSDAHQKAKEKCK